MRVFSWARIAAGRSVLTGCRRYRLVRRFQRPSFARTQLNQEPDADMVRIRYRSAVRYGELLLEKLQVCPYNVPESGARLHALSLLRQADSNYPAAQGPRFLLGRAQGALQRACEAGVATAHGGVPYGTKVPRNRAFTRARSEAYRCAAAGVGSGSGPTAARLRNHSAADLGRAGGRSFLHAHERRAARAGAVPPRGRSPPPAVAFTPQLALRRGPGFGLPGHGTHSASPGWFGHDPSLALRRRADPSAAGSSREGVRESRLRCALDAAAGTLSL